MYAKKQIGEQIVERTSSLDGTSYEVTEPVYGQVWETPWQPDHMPVGSVVEVCVGSPRFNESWTATVTGHIRNGARSWCIITDQPCPVMKISTGKSVNGSHVTRIVSRGAGGVQWKGNDFALSSTHHQALDGPKWAGYGKKKSLYYAASINDLIHTLVNHHPDFTYVLEDDHLYRLYDLDDTILGLFTILPSWEGVTVSKKRVVDALHRHLRTRRVNRKKEQSSSDKAMEKLYENDLELMLGDL